MEDNALRHCGDSRTTDHPKLAQSLCDDGETAIRKMNINDYLVDQSGQDWQELLSGWAEILPPVFTIWHVNRFGDVILVMDDGSVHLLDIGGGRFERIADSKDHFADQADTSESANNWLLIPLVDQCLGTGLVLTPGQCYGYKIPPFLGGEYTVGNTVTIDLVENYSFLADLWQQTRELPDGTRVRLVVKK
jgi:hypothetical protein